MSDISERYCDFEGASFPRDQFKVDTEWGLVHEVEPRHTIRGTVIVQTSDGQRAEDIKDDF